VSSPIAIRRIHQISTHLQLYERIKEWLKFRWVCGKEAMTNVQQTGGLLVEPRAIFN
jgi:hypothetical protein